MSMRPSAASQNVPLDLKDFASDVEYYLALEPRQLPSRYLYDALGSALFDTICELPWYGITRAELGLLATHGRAILAHSATPTKLSRIVELGPGNGTKLRTLIEAADDGPAEAGHYGRQSEPTPGLGGSRSRTLRTRGASRTSGTSRTPSGRRLGESARQSGRGAGGAGRR